MLAFILLLLVGTEILNWQFVIVIPVAALGLGFWIARRRLPDAYRTAQIVDRRLGLADTLSTAYYFAQPENARRGDPEILRWQSETAERIAATADVRQAVPYALPRAVYAMAALFLVAGSLFALRYGISHRLDLKQPLATMLHQTFGSSDKSEQARARMPKVPKPDIAPDGDLASSDDLEQNASTPQDPNADGTEDSAEMQGKADSSKSSEASKKGQQAGDQNNADQDAGSEDRSADGDSPGSNQENSKQDGKQGNNQQDANNSGDNSSLMSKVKDAVQNLLSKMKPQQNQSGGQQQSGEQNGQQGKGQQNGAKQQSAKNGQQQSGSEQADAEEGQAGEQAQNSQDQQGKGTGNSDAKQASKQPGSGVGSQDGEKRLKEAEQLAAMGKISEILGKRAQTISGETTVEVKDTNQQLKTQYTSRSAQHSQTGAEIGRDEIPVALQSYVESYFEQVRKQAPPAPKK